MSRTREQGSQVELVRWSLAMAAANFGRDPKTLKKNVAAANVVPGDDGLFSTLEMAKAIFGDIEGERLRKTKEEADKLELENAQTRMELVSVELVYKHFEGVFISFRQKILASALTEDEKQDLLNDLCRLKAKDLQPTGAAESSQPPVSNPDAPTPVQRPRVGRRAAVS